MTVTNPNDPWRYCPAHMLDTFREYVNKGVKPAGFALALLENNLLEALATADRINYTNLQNYVIFLKSAIPKMAYGSRENVNAWVVHKQLSVAEIANDQSSVGEDLTKNTKDVPSSVPKRPRGRPKRNPLKN